MQTGTALWLPGGPGAREQANWAMWHLGCKHVARWRAKRLVGGLYLFFKELVKFICTQPGCGLARRASPVFVSSLAVLLHVNAIPGPKCSRSGQSLVFLVRGKTHLPMQTASAKAYTPLPPLGLSDVQPEKT